MPEALTESFCERCGTRYEFAAPTQLSTMRKTRGLISGLKNYIMSQDALSDAVGDAIRSEEEALASQQLDAFHESFNFCINCRQYTCLNCWNDDAGRCRTCVPIAGTDDLIERFEATFQAQHPELAAQATAEHMAEAELNRRLGLEAWPTEDLAATGATTNGRPPVTDWPAEEALPDLAAEAEVAAEPERETQLEPEPVVEVADEPEPVVLEAAEPEPVIAEVATEPEPTLAVTAPPALRVLTWDEDVEFELEPAPVVAEAEPEPEPEPVAAEVEPEPEPEPVAELPPPQPIRPISETILHIPQPAMPEAAPTEEERVAAQADDAALAARRAQLDLLGIGDPGEGALAPDRKVLPYRSSGASVHPVEIAARTASGLPAPGAFWEASAREVAGAMSHIGVQSCGECGLSLSASARFCRRCGTRQAQPA